jgi:hypothetical protein
MTHDYKRHGTTTLFAALNVLDGQVIGQCQLRHTHAEWLKFLRQIDRETPKDKTLHLIELRHPQAARCAGVAGQASEVPHAPHPDLGILAAHGGVILPQHHHRAAAPGRVHQTRAALGQGRGRRKETTRAANTPARSGLVFPGAVLDLDHHAGALIRAQVVAGRALAMCGFVLGAT